jgi:hypothetical protein
MRSSPLGYHRRFDGARSARQCWVESAGTRNGHGDVVADSDGAGEVECAAHGLREAPGERQTEPGLAFALASGISVKAVERHEQPSGELIGNPRILVDHVDPGVAVAHLVSTRIMLSDENRRTFDTRSSQSLSQEVRVRHGLEPIARRTVRRPPDTTS